MTGLDSSLMPAEVIAAWVDASRHLVNLLELQDPVGERIANLVAVRAALVTMGDAGALVLGRPRRGLTFLSAVATRRPPRP